ncbi:MAG: hypothetical protein FE78DRAFT_166033 [Acidomyces sp. 'richmondensis']|nr:MAG: hypothetical protein FE78DRAFT_166033 [Acidomyces sp. 'richmondensis']
MSGPNQVRIKRKRHEAAPDTLIYETRGRRRTNRPRDIQRCKSAAGVLSDNDLGDVGYLIISEDDQSVWETYLEDETSDKGWDTDDEDENAEDYYGADYPEDELPSDDEFDRNAYHFRNRGNSDEESWDEDTGAYSEDEYDRLMNPWKGSRLPQ